MIELSNYLFVWTNYSNGSAAITGAIECAETMKKAAENVMQRNGIGNCVNVPLGPEFRIHTETREVDNAHVR